MDILKKASLKFFALIIKRVVNAIDDFSFASPTTITSSSNFIFISDSDNYEIYKFSLDGDMLFFGDRRVRHELEIAQEKRTFWYFQEKVGKIAIVIGIILLILCGIYVLYFEKHKDSSKKLH